MNIIDSSVWVALFLTFDTNHQKAKALIGKIARPIFVPYSVVAEVTTVLAYKHSKKQADNFIDYINGNRDIILLNNDLNEELRFFKTLKKRLSFTDASLMYLSQKLGVSMITFDKQLARALKTLGNV
jgi:predicted nucleic acid-binding protein